jgi:hypothetical protein
MSKAQERDVKMASQDCGGANAGKAGQIKQPRSQDLAGAAAAKELVVMERVVGDFCRIGLG